MRKCNIIRLFFLLALFVHTGAHGQEKVTEASASRTPSWIGVSVKECLVASASAGTLEEAKSLAMADIRRQIVHAIASNIVAVEEMYVSSEKINGKEDVRRGYGAHVRTTAAVLPFITGISFSDAEAYWEKILNKKTKEYHYSYHLKYDFPKSRLDGLIAEYRALDAEQWGKYEALKAAYDTFSEVEDIAVAINELSALGSWFEDGWRRDEVLALQKNYREAYTGIYVMPVANRPGEFRYRLMFKERVMQCARKPVLKSDYATELEWLPGADGSYMVNYSTEGVRDYDKKEILLVYQFGSRPLRYVINFELQ